MSELRTRISDAVKAAMKAGDKPRLSALRLVSAAIKQKEVDERKELTDEDVISILSRMIKQRRESITHYEHAGRDDLARGEQAEIEVIEEFLPKPLSAIEIDQIIDRSIAEAGADSVRDMGKVMAIARPRLQGRADMAVVSARIKAKLGG
jgi:uncharacterized protein YqeY